MEPSIKDIDTGHHEPILEIEAKYTDGTSYRPKLDPVWNLDMQGVLRKLLEDEQARAVARLSPKEQAEYDRFEEESECHCDGTCLYICWHEMMDREEWLKQRAEVGVIVEWRWRLEDESSGPGGSVELDDCNTIIEEYPEAPIDILAPIT